MMEDAARVQISSIVPIMSFRADFLLIREPINNHTEPLIVTITYFPKRK